MDGHLSKPFQSCLSYEGKIPYPLYMRIGVNTLLFIPLYSVTLALCSPNEDGTTEFTTGVYVALTISCNLGRTRPPSPSGP